jgi:hypothetical protein
MEIIREFGRWVLAVVKGIYGWIGGASATGIVAFGDAMGWWKATTNTYKYLLLAGVVVSLFDAWRKEHRAVAAAQGELATLAEQLRKEREQREHDTIPILEVNPRQATTFQRHDEDMTVVLLHVDIINKGATTVALIGKGHYKSPTFDADVEIINILDDVLEVPVGHGQKLRVRQDEWLRMRANQGIGRGLLVQGQLPFIIPGNRGKEIMDGVGVVTFSVQDYTGKEWPSGFQAGPENRKDQKFKAYPGDRVV